MLEREPVSNRRAVIHNIHAVPVGADLVGQFLDDISQMRECVLEPGMVGRVALTIAGIVGRDHAVAVRKQRYEVAEHVRRGRKAVQEQDDRCVPGAGLAEEDVHAVDRRALVVNDGNCPDGGGDRGLWEATGFGGKRSGGDQ